MDIVLDESLVRHTVADLMFLSMISCLPYYSSNIVLKFLAEFLAVHHFDVPFCIKGGIFVKRAFYKLGRRESVLIIKWQSMGSPGLIEIYRPLLSGPATGQENRWLSTIS